MWSGRPTVRHHLPGAAVSRSALLQAVEMTSRYRRRVRDFVRRGPPGKGARATGSRRAGQGVLMQARNMTEPEAFRTMQKTSMDTGIPIREIAQVILETDGRQLCRFG